MIFYRFVFLILMFSKFRSRKTSITTGVVDRSDQLKQEYVDRLSPLTSASASGSLQWPDLSIDLEKYCDIELECGQGGQSPIQHSSNNVSIVVFVYKFEAI